MDKDQSLYETNSLVLGSTLICLGIPLQSIYKNTDGKSIFVFPQTPELDQSLKAFWQKSLLIEPNTFFEAQRFLKSRIYGGNNG